MIRHLKDELRACDDACESFNPIAYGTILGLNGAISFANTLPAADVVEVKHGYWNYDGSCGVCKKQILSNYMNYCPHCGAKMEGATDNNVGDKGR